jgi:hypothetical protein
MNTFKRKILKITSWLLIVTIFGCFIKSCNDAKIIKWHKQVVKYKIDSIKVGYIQSVYPVEPRYTLYLSNGHTVTIANNQYNYNTDSIEFTYYKKN